MPGGFAVLWGADTFIHTQLQYVLYSLFLSLLPLTVTSASLIHSLPARTHTPSLCLPTHALRTPHALPYSWKSYATLTTLPPLWMTTEFHSSKSTCISYRYTVLICIQSSLKGFSITRGFQVHCKCGAGSTCSFSVRMQVRISPFSSVRL